MGGVAALVIMGALVWFMRTKKKEDKGGADLSSDGAEWEGSSSQQVKHEVVAPHHAQTSWAHHNMHEVAELAEGGNGRSA